MFRYRLMSKYIPVSICVYAKFAVSKGCYYVLKPTDRRLPKYCVTNRCKYTKRYMEETKMTGLRKESKLIKQGNPLLRTRFRRTDKS